MLRQIEGSRAVAETVALCRRGVCAIHFAPDPHHQAVGAMVKEGTLAPCEYINVESEFAAMSVAIGARRPGRGLHGDRSQGLYMIEAVQRRWSVFPLDDARESRHTDAINIWNDHSDACSA